MAASPTVLQHQPWRGALVAVALGGAPFFLFSLCQEDCLSNKINLENKGKREKIEKGREEAEQQEGVGE